MRPFPLPVVGPGSYDVEEAAEYLPMPHDMTVFRAPVVEPESAAAAAETRAALSDLLAAMRTHEFSAGSAPRLDLTTLSPQALRLTNQAMGQGEVSAVAHAARSWRIEETTFASIWHVLAMREDGGVAEDFLEVADVPAVLRATARAVEKPAAIAAIAPAGVMNSPALLNELQEQSALWRPGKAAHVINLTLLPVTPQDLDHLGQSLGVGPVTLLSRGYGNCRITSTRLPHTWWVQYFNSMDAMILNTIEVADVPEVALAAREDFEDSRDRLAEWLETLREEA
jgi:hydrogenase-1 operon protein HyaF